jgi:P2 family phage contractile tail tube protein
MVQNLINMLIGQEVFVQGYGFIGTTKDIELPKVKFKQTEVNGRNVDTGLLEPIEAKIEVGEYNAVIWEAISKRDHEIATFVIKKSARDRQSKKAIYVELGAWVSEQEFGGKIGDVDSIALDLNVQTYRLEVDGKEMYNIDIPNYVCKINGADKYETLRSHVM